MRLCAYIKVKVVTRASRNEVAGLRGDELQVRLSAPPVGGAANRALVALVAGFLGVPKSSVNIATGFRSRHKLLKVEGMNQKTLQTMVDRLSSSR